MNAMAWIKANPLKVAGAVVLVGILFLMGRGGGGSSDGGMGAFYAAQNASKVSGDQVMIAQIAANSQDRIGLAYIEAQRYLGTTYAATQVSTAQIAANAAVQIAPYQVQSQYLDTVAQIAAMPAQTVTTTTKKKKLFGSSKSSTTTVIPNPGWDLLANFDFDPFD
jgi:hypothetical protein